MTTPCRIFTKGEVLPYRQVSYNDIPRASPPATTATLSTAFTSRWSVGPKDKSPGYSPSHHSPTHIPSLRPPWKAVPRLGVGISNQSVLKCWSAWKAVLSAVFGFACDLTRRRRTRSCERRGAGRLAWKAILSVAFVTGGAALGNVDAE